MNKFEIGLSRDAANFVPLTPVVFLKRSAAVFPDKTAVIHGDVAYTYRTFYERCRRLASALEQRGIGKGDTISVMAPNVPALLEAHYACPMIGAVLNAINVRLDVRTVAFILAHGESKLVITDRSLSDTMRSALETLGRDIAVIDIDDPLDRSGQLLGDVDYEGLLAAGDPGFDWRPPDDEWEALALSYTSGTTGDPKGVVHHHRGAYMNALGNAITFGLGPDSVYLWTLPMFHCCGWSYTWAVTVTGGTHVCLRRVDPALIFPKIRDRKVTHMCGAPIVLSMLIHAPEEQKVAFPQTVEIATGGAAPPTAVIAQMEQMGFRVTHLYGLTESYGPSTVCVWQPGWDEIPVGQRAALMARQGVNLVTLDEQRVADPETMQEVPTDGRTIGMLMLRGNTVMKGYLKNGPATQAAFEGGWLHTGDLAVKHPDGYIEIKDRAKDIILSGGENISSIEVEEVLFLHPDVMEAAVVAAPHDKWGETPCAFVMLRPGSEGTLSAADIIAYCRDNMAHYKAPTMVRFGPLPKTATGKVQKFVLRERAKEKGP